MAEGRHYTPHQKGIIKRYYENRETIGIQRLSDLVSEIYLCENPRKAEPLWKKAEKALLDAGANKLRVAVLMERRDPEFLAKLVGELF